MTDDDEQWRVIRCMCGHWQHPDGSCSHKSCGCTRNRPRQPGACSMNDPLARVGGLQGLMAEEVESYGRAIHERDIARDAAVCLEQELAAAEAENVELNVRLEAAELQLNHVEGYSREMERQRNAYGQALTRIVNGEEPVSTAQQTMEALALDGQS